MPDYMILPVMTGGSVKELYADKMKIHLKGRLGVLTLPVGMLLDNAKVKAGDKLKFYFSYIQVKETAEQYDISGLKLYEEVEPELVGGKISMVNDTAIEVVIMDSLGTILVPRRWVFTNREPCEGQDVEFYLSRMMLW